MPKPKITTDDFCREGSNVSPAFSVFDRVDTSFGDAVQFRQLSLRNPVVQLGADGEHLISRQLTSSSGLPATPRLRASVVMVILSAWVQSVGDRMAHVFSRSQVFQIIRTIVGFIRIFVVDLVPIRASSDKRLGYQLMHISLDLLAARNTQTDSPIAVFIRTCVKNLFGWSPLELISQSFDSTKIRHFITTVKSLDRLPDFHDMIVPRNPYRTEVYV